TNFSSISKKPPALFFEGLTDLIKVINEYIFERGFVFRRTMINDLSFDVFQSSQKRIDYLREFFTPHASTKKSLALQVLETFLECDKTLLSFQTKNGVLEKKGPGLKERNIEIFIDIILGCFFKGQVFDVILRTEKNDIKLEE